MVTVGRTMIEPGAGDRRFPDPDQALHHAVEVRLQLGVAGRADVDGWALQRTGIGAVCAIEGCCW